MIIILFVSQEEKSLLIIDWIINKQVIVKKKAYIFTSILSFYQYFIF